MKSYKKNFEIVFYDAADNFKYFSGIKNFEKLFKKYPEAEKDDLILSRLGMMYDHLALKYPTKRIKYENKALSLYKKALKFNPNSHKATWGIGRIWWHRKSKKALPYAIKAIRLAKKSRDPYGIYISNVGLVYKFIGNDKLAEKWFLKAIKIEPNNWGIYLNLIVLYEKNKQVDKIKKYLPKFKKLVKKEDRSFFKTNWGKRIVGIIKRIEKY